MLALKTLENGMFNGSLDKESTYESLKEQCFSRYIEKVKSQEQEEGLKLVNYTRSKTYVGERVEARFPNFTRF